MREDIHKLFHTLWTKAVGTKDYVKAEWRGMEIILNETMVPPIDMLIWCPACAHQHIDEPKGEWTNPPHRSHYCSNCGHTWRIADVCTNGVAAIQTTGKVDGPAAPAYKTDVDVARMLEKALDLGLTVKSNLAAQVTALELVIAEERGAHIQTKAKLEEVNKTIREHHCFDAD